MVSTGGRVLDLAVVVFGAFAAVLPFGQPDYSEIEPEMRSVGEDQYAACHHPLVEPSPVSAPHR
jgi:hypothetical protein